MPRKPLALIIRDGFGYNPREDGNAVAQGRTPNHDCYCRDFPTALISASGLDVGLPPGNQGSSEVGHQNLGAGRIVYQTLTGINLSIKKGTFYDNAVIAANIKETIAAGGTAHFMGLVQDQGVHAHTEHLLALMRFAKKAGLPSERCLVHVFSDGRDTLPQSAARYVKVVADFIAAEKYGVIASICGRYYAMDRDNRWERVQLAYDLLSRGATERPAFSDVFAAIDDAYAVNENDEFIKPRVIGGFKGIRDKDMVMHFNYRLDRTRELTKAFIEDGFDAFPTVAFNELRYVCMMEYYEGAAVSSRAQVSIALPSDDFSNLFGQFVADRGLHQLRIAETEKYAHVTFFFNGKSDIVFKNEDRVLINSPKVATYDLKPEMSAFEVRDAVLKEIDKDLYDVIVLNYANCDMVGHTGVFDAAVKAVETVDACVGAVVDRILGLDGVVFLTSDHGNAEQMIDYDLNKPMTAHTTNPVWLSMISRRPELQNDRVRIADDGVLADVIPSMIHVMGLPQPEEMTGRNLVEKAK